MSNDTNKYCTTCGEANSSVARFCQACGNSFQIVDLSADNPKHTEDSSKNPNHRSWLFLLPVFAFLLLLYGVWEPLFLTAIDVDHSAAVSIGEDQSNYTSASCADVEFGALNLDHDTRHLENLSATELMLALDEPVYVSPPNPNGHTPVDIGLFVTEITEIDPGSNSFWMKGFVDLVWCDPRENFDRTEIGVDSKIFLEADAEQKLENIWWPDIELVNEVQRRSVENEELIIYADGTIEYREQFLAKLATNFDLARLPFDTQTLRVEIESFAWSSEDLQFHVRREIVNFSDEFSIPEWQIIGLEEHLNTVMEVRDRAPFSELIANISVRRDPGFFVMKIILPLMIIVAISWSVFWMAGDGLSDRLGVSFTGVLTSVAYQFIVSENVPRHLYNTFLDALILFSFIMMVLTIIQSIAVNLLHLQGNEARGRRIDFLSRWQFPLFYFGGLAILTQIYLT